MPAHAPITRQSFGRPFVVAVTVLGLVAVAQLTAVTLRFLQATPGTANGNGGRQPPDRIDVAKLMAEMPPPPDEALSVGTDPLETEPVVVGSTGARPVPVRPEAVPVARSSRPPAPTVVVQPTASSATTGFPLRPTPVPLSEFTEKVDPRFIELIEQGKLLRNNGDTAGAVAKFKAANAFSPTNPQAIAELAFTYEKMTLHDRAAEQWRIILAMGEGAGAFYSAAKAKLDAAVGAAVRETAPPGPATIAEGHVLGLGRPGMVVDSDPASTKKFILQVPIRAKAGQQVVVRDMKVFVLFYDRLNGQDLASTAANVSNRWSDPPADWADGDTETLEVFYDLPPFEGRGERREYYGYVVRLYYQGALQDTQAEPASLNQRFPAPATLSE